jgi:S-adenosylmethionine:diacylglycerol 3-amino-3-carboxypropyl transferase
MIPLYNFGLSQEDPLTEIKGLDLTDGDSLLCIASGGEVPLSIAALNNVSIIAIDASEDQLRLCRIKQKSAMLLEPPNAAGFLGYTRMPFIRRENLFEKKIAPALQKEDLNYWRKNIKVIRTGVIHAGKFEQFICKASLPARAIIGGKNFYRLFDCNSATEQEDIFDRFFSGVLLKTIFKTVFHPRIYKNRGIDAAGMLHHQKGNIGDFFFNRFRNFCCGTPARDNFLLQYVFFRQSLFTAALPEYLKIENRETFLQNHHKISFISSRMEDFLAQAQTGQYDKIQISNIGDWLPIKSMARLFEKIQEKTQPGSRMIMRHIYLEHPVPESVPFLKPDHKLGEQLMQTDRFPFSSIVPIRHIKHEQLSDQTR